MGAAAMACYAIPFGPQGSAPLAERALAFSLLALSPLFHAYNCRSATSSFLSLRPILPVTLVGAVLISAGIHLIAVLVPAVRPVFQTFALSARDWALLLVLAASILPAVEGLKLVERRMGREPMIEKWLGPLSGRPPALPNVLRRAMGAASSFFRFAEPPLLCCRHG
jgi:Ca2+-transporting ATPase